MLGGDKDVVDSNGLDLASLLLILDDNLRFAVRSQPCDFTGVSLLCHLFADLVCEVMGVREESLGVPLIGGVAEHDALVASAKVLFFLLSSTVDGLGDVGILRLNLQDNLAVVAVESIFNGSEADLLADISCDLLEVDWLTLVRDLSKEDDLNATTVRKLRTGLPDLL